MCASNDWLKWDMNFGGPRQTTFETISMNYDGGSKHQNLHADKAVEPHGLPAMELH